MRTRENNAISPALRHNGQYVDQHRIERGKHAPRDLVALLGRIARIFQSTGKIHVRTHKADDLLSLVAHLEHGVLSTRLRSGVKQDARVGGYFFLDDKTISWH